jgi:hypothetical protein
LTAGIYQRAGPADNLRPRNQKLTSAIQARTVQVSTAKPGELVIRFDDEPTMKVKTAGIADIFPPGAKIKAVQEDGTEFAVQFEGGRR